MEVLRIGEERQLSGLVWVEAFGAGQRQGPGNPGKQGSRAGPMSALRAILEFGPMSGQYGRNSILERFGFRTVTHLLGPEIGESG